MKTRGGYTMVTLLVFLSILVIGLMVAVPVWQTQLQRESEEELIFRGNQYVEAVRRYEQKNPGAFPKDIEDLIKARCLRRHFPDPMTKDGKWYLITASQAAGPSPRPGRGSLSGPNPKGGTSTFSFTARPAAAGQVGGRAVALVLVPEELISGVQNVRILGVASKSDRDSIRVYNGATIYNEWLFYLGQDPNSKPEVTIYGREEKK
jgi:type II secretory pathway pseudopilin PulG